VQARNEHDQGAAPQPDPPSPVRPDYPVPAALILTVVGCFVLLLRSSPKPAPGLRGVRPPPPLLPFVLAAAIGAAAALFFLSDPGKWRDLVKVALC
jgi:hypothetical protein